MRSRRHGIADVTLLYADLIVIAQRRKRHMTLERTILLVVGLVVLGSVALAALHSPHWLWLTAAMGLHLVQASVTGFCPVVIALKRLGVPSKAGFA